MAHDDCVQHITRQLLSCRFAPVTTHDRGAPAFIRQNVSFCTGFCGQVLVEVATLPEVREHDELIAKGGAPCLAEVSAGVP